jgi:hypothetical protein
MTSPVSRTAPASFPLTPALVGPAGEVDPGSDRVTVLVVMADAPGWCAGQAF